jgi:hypothetical protein
VTTALRSLSIGEADNAWQDDPELEPLRADLRAVVAGDTAALARVLVQALQLDPGSPTGKAVRRCVARGYRRQAKRLLAQAETATGARAARLRGQSHRAYLLALVATNLGALPSAARERGSPAAAETATRIVLDPAPDPPTDVLAWTSGVGNASVTVAWRKPYDYGKAITGNTVTPYDALTNAARPASPAPGNATQATVGGLVTGRFYFTVKATNADGTSSESVRSNDVTLGVARPQAPTAVQPLLPAGTGTATVTVTTGAGAPFLGFLVRAYDAAGAVVATGATNPALFSLPNGTYTFGARILNAGGWSDETVSSQLVVNVQKTETHPTLVPSLSSEPALVLDQAVRGVDFLGRLFTEAGALAEKWRFEYLKAQAVSAAADTMAYESYLAQLMQMTVAKASTGELLASPIWAGAIQTLLKDRQTLSSIATAPNVASVTGELGGLVSQALLLELIVLWLLEFNPIDFWTGLFNALIDDIATLSTGLYKTSGYLKTQLGNQATGSIGEAVADAAQALTSGLEAEVDRFAAPLRAAVSGIVGGTSEAAKMVFASYDLPLLMTPVGDGGAALPNYNPLFGAYAGFNKQVDALLDAVKASIRSSLGDVANLTTTGQDLFVAIMRVYVVLPILAFLVIAIAGGPFAAAALAAVVLFGAEELAHLLARWLAGPLLSEVERAKQRVFDKVGELQGIFARQAVLLESPDLSLRLLAAELHELRSLLPEEFLNDAAELLEDARDATVEHAQQLALAAEQALGREGGTAFDVIPRAYAPALSSAPQLPGGSDPSRLLGAALLRDLDRLERQRTLLRDGKEVELTHRISLFRLLGGVTDPAGAVTAAGEFAKFLASGELVVHLDEETLLDRSFPGLYRALIKEVRVTGIFNAARPALGAAGVPITVTHLGPSRTRIKRDANPVAPPVSLPDCFPPSAGDLEGVLLDPNRLKAMARDATYAYLQTFRFPTKPVLASGSAPFTLDLRAALLGYLPDAIAREAEAATCGLVDPSFLTDAARETIKAQPMTLQSSCGWGWLGGTKFGFVCPGWGWLVTQAAWQIDPFVVNTLRPALVPAIRRAHEEGLRQIQEQVNKWGGATIVEDPDPHVRSLGFATLVRGARPETAAFNLFPAEDLGTRAAEAASTGADGQPPVTQATTLQYRPFENRGLEGDLLVALEPTAAAAALTDLILEVTFRACHDDALAATVRASQSQRSSQRALAQVVAGGALKTITFPGEKPELAAGRTQLRTIHFSMRAHRDRLLQAAIAAEQAKSGTLPAAGTNVTVDGLAFTAGRLPLARDDDFAGLTAAVSSDFELSFATTPPASLGALNGAIPVTPNDLGYPPNLLTSPEAQLVSLGLAVIPNQTNGYRLRTTLVVSSLLQSLLPSFGYTQRFALTSPGTAPVGLASIWNAAVPQTLEVQLSSFRGGVPEFYDVIFSLTVRVPALRTQTTIDALR